MPRGAGLGLVCLALVSGCAGIGRPKSPAPSPERWAQLQAVSQSAQSAIDRGDYGEARELLGRLIAEDPGSAEAYHRLGLVCEAEQSWAAAEQAYRKSLELEPDYVDAMIGLGRLRTRMGQPELALVALDEAVDLDPSRPDAQVDRGKALEAIGRRDESLAAYYRALDIAPDTPDALFRVAAAQLARGRAESALARIDQLIELRPTDPEVHYRRGQALLELGQLPEAMAELDLAASQLTQRPDVLYDLAVARERSHQPEAALEAANQALAIAPQHAAARELSERLTR